MAEQGHSSINLEGKLGFEAQISGGSAFSQLTDALTTRLKQEPTFANVLQQFVDYTRSEDTRAHGLRFNDKREPELLSEELLGKWVGLAAEHTLLDAKKMPSEADGARWIALDGQVARLEDAILTAHRGEKSVTVDERFIRIIADPSGDTQKRIAESLDDVTKTIAATTARTAKKVLPVVIAGTMLFSACNPRSTITPETTMPAITQTVETTPTIITGPGPESTGTPDAPIFLQFPTQLTLAQATSGLAENLSLPPTFNADTQLMREIRDTIAIHQSWCNLDAPCTGTLQAVYSETYHRWTTTAMDNNGNITEWMLIHTDTGDHWAEQPFWDSLLAGKTTAEINQMILDGEIEFILPPHTVDASHFEAMWQNGFLILVEVDKNGNPFQWNTLNRGMQTIVGTETPTPAAPEWQKAEYSGDLIICPNTQKPEDVLPNRSYQVQVEGQTVEINPQQYMIGLTIRDTERRGKNAAEISALEAKYLSQDKTFDAWIRIANRAYVFSHAQQIGLNPADIANQSDEQIFWEVMQLSQLNHQILIPNPLEIRSWYQDYSLSFDSSDGSKSYDGIYASERIGRGNSNPLEHYINVIPQRKTNYPIFGITIEVPRSTYRGVLGRQAALFALPGWGPEQMIMPVVYYQGPDGKAYFHYLTAALTPEAAMIHQGDFYRTNSWGFDESQLFFADRDYQFKYGLLSPFLPIHQWTLEELIDNLGKGIYFFYLDDGSYGPQNPAADQPFLFGIERANKIVISDPANSLFPWEQVGATPATPTP